MEKICNWVIMGKKIGLWHCRKDRVTYIKSANSSNPSRWKFQDMQSLANCPSVVIKILPWIWISKSQTKNNDLCNIWINSVMQQLVLDQRYFSALRNISAFSALSFSQWALCSAGLFFDIRTVQGWWRWLVREGHAGEKVPVSGMAAVSWNNGQKLYSVFRS